jgi:hypothetical protein
MAKKYTEIECLCQLNFGGGIETVVVLKKTLFAGCSKTFRYKAPE